MNSRRATFLTARREVRERLRSRAFLFSMGLILALVAGIFAIAVVADDGPSDVRLAVVGDEAAAVGEAVANSGGTLGVDIETSAIPSAAAAREAVRAGDVDLALAGDRLLTGSGTSQQAVAAVRAAARSLEMHDRLRAEGLTASEADRVLGVAPITVHEVAGAEEDGAGLALYGSIVLYLAIFTAGLQVATGVVEEKGSRVVELILSTIRPAHLLVGKVIGLGLTTLLQLALAFGLGIGLALATGEVDLPSSTAAATALAVAYFVLGYAFYACAFAAAGSLVSRQEDVQSVTTPLTIALVGSYVASIGIIDDPESTFARVCSVVPLSAPMVVPVRAAQDALPTGDLVASLVAMVVGTVALIYTAARIYERGVLRMGAPLKLGQAIRLARPR